MSQTVVTDCVEDLVELENTWKDARERMAMHLALMIKELSESNPVLASGKRMRGSLEHAIGLFIELSSVTSGVMEGVLTILKRQLNQCQEDGDEQRSSNKFVH